ncbi:DMT family transporter [Longivirga aurantiaca]|uniref:DMT family transporter n=1 Tax=Longivirga aurantiaca TaxID=1837743 RepID=A0ABW1SYA5_9ACTN
MATTHPSAERHTPPPREWLGAWVGLTVVWGFVFYFIKLALESFEPVQVAFGRCFLGALTLLLVAAATRTRLPRGRVVWIDLAVVALLLNTLPYLLFAWAETRVSSVLAGIWNAATPLFVLAFGLLITPWEKATREKLVGLAIGFLGALVVLGFWDLGNGGDPLGSLACIAATACYGIGMPYTRRRLVHRAEPAVSLMSGQLLMSSLQLGVLTLLFSSAPSDVTPVAAWSMVFLGVLGTGWAFLLNFRLIADTGGVVAASVTYAMPVVSTAAGVLLLGEALTWNQPVGALIVLSGVALVQGLARVPLRRTGDGIRDHG